MPKFFRNSSINRVKPIQVLYIESIVGRGEDISDPVRKIHEIYDMKGNLITRLDPFKKSQELEASKRKMPLLKVLDKDISGISFEIVNVNVFNNNKTLSIDYILEGKLENTNVSIQAIIENRNGLKRHAEVFGERKR